jgi:GT2 family glycosyltransferase
MRETSAAGLKNLGLVVIGRNEGDRLVRCLDSVRGIPNRVYVDSGSTDGSVEYAVRQGVEVLQLEMPPNFTAARARNVGLARLLARCPLVEFVQMVDGDCEIHQDWIPAAVAALNAEPDLAAVYGRLRERFPDRSVYNAICDNDWNKPVGEAAYFGGNVLLRVPALQQVNFYDASMIAGEEPDMSMRLRKSGWRLRRIDAEMGYHDVNLTRFSQWWKRTRRTGHAYAELAFRHPDARHPNWLRTTRSIVFWGGLLPLGTIGAVAIAEALGGEWWQVAGVVLLFWLWRIVLLTLRGVHGGFKLKFAFTSAVLLMIGTLPQLLGLIKFHRNRVLGRESRLMEHKGST